MTAATTEPTDEGWYIVTLDDGKYVTLRLTGGEWMVPVWMPSDLLLGRKMVGFQWLTD